jgi:hypothetical protein
MIHDRHIGEHDSFGAKLEPLTRGYAVSMTMQDPRHMRNPKYRGKKQNQFIGLAPGPLYGLPTGSILVSIVGSGSCVIRPFESNELAKLVLAGMPAGLAKVLVTKLKTLYEGAKNGNSSTTHAAQRGRFEQQEQRTRAEQRFSRGRGSPEDARGTGTE